MTKREFERLMDKMIDVYGVRSSRIDGDEDLWFECPECGEPILYEDWADDPDLAESVCPVCDFMFEVEEYDGILHKLYR